jgi:hypothetical protein
MDNIKGGNLHSSKEQQIILQLLEYKSMTHARKEQMLETLSQFHVH